MCGPARPSHRQHRNGDMMPTAVVTEITAGGAPFLGVASFDLDPLGYEQAEYMLSGVANAYARTDDSVSVARSPSTRLACSCTGQPIRARSMARFGSSG